jgi:plasmid maintenance system killer protein
MNKPGWNLHQLKGQKAGIWLIKVSGNWRMGTDKLTFFMGQLCTNRSFYALH